MKTALFQFCGHCSSNNTREDSTHGHHQMVNTEIRLIVFFSAKDGVSKTRPGADCGSDHELLIAKYRLKSKKVEKTTRPFRYDLNQIPYDYTVGVRKVNSLYLDSKQSQMCTESLVSTTHNSISEE